VNPALIPVLGSAIKGIIDRVIPDKDKAIEAKKQVDLETANIHRSELKGAIDIILAEAKGDSWLQRSWRPLLMIWFAGLIGAHWLGYTAPNLSEPQILSLLELVKVGMGGYVITRGGEKIAREVSNWNIKGK